MAKRLIVMGAGLLYLLTACASMPHGHSAIHGELVWLPHSQPVHDATARPTGGTAQVVKDGRVVARIKVGTTGHFTVALPPGTYVVRGVPLGPGDSAACRARSPIRLQSGQIVSVDVSCHYTGVAPG
jgi:hypothetical protein